MFYSERVSSGNTTLEATAAADGLPPSATAALGRAALAFHTLRVAEARALDALHALDAENIATTTGHRSTRRLVEEHLRLDPAHARRWLRESAAVSPQHSVTGEPLPPALPATAAALAHGRLAAGHVTVIERTMRRVDRLEHIDPATRAVTEEQLAALGADRSPHALADAAVEILALLEPDGAAPTDTDVPANELHALRRRDGTLVGTFRYTDPAAAELIATALDAATPAPEADGITPDSDQREPLRTQAERRAQGLLDLAAEALTRGGPDPDPDPDDAGESGDGADDPRHEPDVAAAPAPANRPRTEGGERVHLAVTIDWELLRTELGHSGRRAPLPGLAHLGLGVPVGPETARRLACDAEIIPAVLGARGQPLDIGRRTRVVPAPLRAAVVLRDRRCAHPGCRRRPRRCAVHHLRHWAHGGETAIENLVLLCTYHHTLAHHGGWTITMRDGLPWFTPPRWLDPTRQPRHNRPAGLT